MTATDIRVPGAVLTEREHARPAGPRPPRRPDDHRVHPRGGRPRRARPAVPRVPPGRPGFEATRPTSPPSGWMKRALAEYRVLLLDQRGTGRSTPVGPEIPGETAADQAAYLTHFRADSIVRDAELDPRGARRRPLERPRPELRRLHLADLPLDRAGGPARRRSSPAACRRSAGPSTTSTAPRGSARCEANRRYFERYPDDRARVREIHRRLEAEDVRLPSGDRLTARRFRQLGMWLGDSAGFELLHHVLELPFGSPAFLHDVEGARPLGAQPDLRHAPRVLVRGRRARPAGRPHRLLPDEVERDRGVHRRARLPVDVGGVRRAARPHRAAAELLAEHPWPRLYDADRLRRNEVPVAATIYVDDVYVERAFAEETAALVRGLRPWITNEYEHNGLRADGERVLGRLIDMVKGRA